MIAAATLVFAWVMSLPPRIVEVPLAGVVVPGLIILFVVREWLWERKYK